MICKWIFGSLGLFVPLAHPESFCNHLHCHIYIFNLQTFLFQHSSSVIFRIPFASKVLPFHDFRFCFFCLQLSWAICRCPFCLYVLYSTLSIISSLNFAFSLIILFLSCFNLDSCLTKSGSYLSVFHQPLE